MKTTPALLALILAASATFAEKPASTAAAATPVDLRCEYAVKPAPFSNPKPRFGWRLEAAKPGFWQEAYHLLVASSADLLAQNKGDLWDSGDTPSYLSQAVLFGGEPLKSKQTAHWKVRVKDGDGNYTPWSAAASFTVDPELPPTLPQPLFLAGQPSRSAVVTSDPALNKLFEAAPKALPKVTGLRDASLALRSAMYHSDSAFPRAEQWFLRANEAVNAGGLYPATLPSKGTQASTESDAPIMMAYTLWWMTGDNSLLVSHWPTMMGHVRTRMRLDSDFIGKPLGTLPPDTLPAGDNTPARFIHLISVALNLRFLHGTNRAAGRGPFEVLKIRQSIQSYHDSFKATHFSKKGDFKYSSLTAQLLALRSGLLLTPEEKDPLKASLLKALKGSNQSPFEQGPFAAFHILPVLTWSGQVDEALALAKAQNPENLSPVALASISEWLISMVAGIETEDYGFKHIRLTPFIPAPEVLQSAKGHYDSPYGRISTAWRHEDGAIFFEASTPPSTTVLVQLPIAEDQTITEGGKPVEGSDRFTDFTRKDGMVSFRSRDGSFKFRIGK